LDYAANIIKLAVKLKNPAIKYIANQLMRAASSAGANYEEACGAESRADFIHKIQIVLKELRESLFWLRLMLRSGLIQATEIQILINEADELAKIIAKSIMTAKQNS